MQMRARTWDLVATRGETVRRRLQFRNAEGSTEDLSLFSWRGPIQEDYLTTEDAESFTFSLSTDQDGAMAHAVEFSLSSAQTLGLEARRYVSQIWAIDGDGEPTVALHISLTIKEQA